MNRPLQAQEGHTRARIAELGVEGWGGVLARRRRPTLHPRHAALADKLASSSKGIFPPAESAELIKLLDKQSQSASAISWPAITQSLNTACASSYETKQVANRWNYLKTRPEHKALADTLAGRKRASVAAAAPKRSKKQRTQRPAEPTLETVVAGPTPPAHWLGRCTWSWSSWTMHSS